jgi:hypothetical protein
MKLLDELYLNLRNFSDFDARPDNPELFLATADEIVLRKDPTSIPILLSYFDDESEYGWVMESLMVTLESYENQVYVEALIKNLTQKSIFWVSGLIFGIFNNSECLSIFRKNIHLANKQSLLILFHFMEKESPHHSPLIQELRFELEKIKN